MSCNVKYENIIFSIYKKTRLGNDEFNVFIGNVNDKINNILKKLEKRSTILKDEVLMLKSAYPNYYMEWINIVKKNIKIRFINAKIEIDDTLSDIRKKIFVYMSNKETNDYILPENQEFWLAKTNGETTMIGYYYENKDTEEKLNYKPSIFEVIDKKTLDQKMDKSVLKKNTSENNNVIYDILNEGEYIRNIIFMCNAKDDEKYFKLKKIHITDSIKNNYFKKYWPYVNLSYNLEDVKNSMTLLSSYLTKEQYIFDIVDNTKINNNVFGTCNIQIIYFKISDTRKNDEEIDLFQILDYLKDNQLGDKTPFIKYSEENFDAPFLLISKKAINNGIVDKDVLTDWMGLNNREDTRKTNGLSIKRYIKNYEDKPRFYSLLLNKYGELQLTISYLNSNKATFEDVELAVGDCKTFIDNINKNRIVRKVNEKAKIELPDFKYNNGNIITNEYTKITYINITIPITLDKSIDFKSLYNFSKQFPYFIVEAPKNLLKKSNSATTSNENNKDEKSLKIRYRRISGFVNMNDILFDIDKLKEKGLENAFIVKLLQKKYEKTADEIKSYIYEWEKKYSSSKSSKISSDIKKGILVTITDNKILVHGITKTYQIPLIYRFFTTFMTMFLNYDNYIKNKNFKKIFTGKNINNDEYSNVFENLYEFKNHRRINLSGVNYTDYDIDEFYNSNNELLMDEEKNENEEENQMNKYESQKEIKQNNMTVQKFNNNNEYKNKIVGMASLNDVGTDIVLKCNDAIPEKGTCRDFCNDEYYFIRRLQLYDIKLFKPNKGVKGKYEKYTKSCQAKRQPVILPYDPEKDPRVKRDSYSYAIKYSSDPNTFQRWYICPKIWCAYCEIPISESDIDKSTIKLRATKNKGRMCRTVLCPFGDHLAYVKDKESESEIYPGFISKNIHPQGLCLPCCFKKPKNKPKTPDFFRMQKCMGETINNDVDVKEGQIYILGKGLPIEKNRYGKLNIEMERLLKTNLETGYLGNKSGYLRKGIIHHKNNSFLSAISDVIGCDKKNSTIDVPKIKKILVDKLDENMFKSLYSGNLPNIFYNLENFKKYLLSESVLLEHKYIWDFLQRENVLTDEGINIFIFENNSLLCPKGENISFYYDKTKKSVLLYKFNQYYEPIYYLEGVSKSAKITCLFNYEREEIKKIFDISMEGCKDYTDIDWIEVLKNNMDKYHFNVDNVTTSNGEDLPTTLYELLSAIKNKKLSNKFIPELQYVDTYNKVFGIKLSNGLYLPVSPTKINVNLKYISVNNMNDISKLSVRDTIKLTEEITKNTKLGCDIKFKVNDLKTKTNIVALVNSFNRFIPVITQKDTFSEMKNALINYFADIDESLFNKIEQIDNRIEIMNKKKFEDETFMRLKFELSKFIQLKENKMILNEIIQIINSTEKDISKSRNLMYVALNKIFMKLISIKTRDTDFYNYNTPNKRIPCGLRSTNIKKKSSSNNEVVDGTVIKLGCNDDPHCINVSGSCKLFVNKINLIDTDRKIDNYDFYLSKIVEELLRYKLKRNEILNDNIPIIINKQVITENINKYVVVNTLNFVDLENVVEKLFLDNNGIMINTKNLYEEISTNDIGFKKDKFLKINVKEINELKTNDLSSYWLKYLGYEYSIKLNTTDSLLVLLLNVINLTEFKNNRNNKILTTTDLKDIIVRQISASKNKGNVLLSYTQYNPLKNIPDVDILKETLLKEEYKGTEADLNIISQHFNINIIILDKRIKKNGINMKLIKSKNYKTDFFIILYKTVIIDTNIYNLIQSKSKVIFRLKQFPNKFINYIDNVDKMQNLALQSKYKNNAK